MGPVGFNLSLSSDSLASRSDSSPILLQGEGNSYCSSFSSGSLVSVSTTSFQVARPSSFFNDSFTGNFQRQSVPTQPFRLFASRVDTISWGLRSKGFSDNVIEKVVGSFRDGTQRTYQSAWKNFMGYLEAQNIPHSKVSVPVVCDYLDYFCIFVEREYRTLTVYKCALKHFCYMHAI